MGIFVFAAASFTFPSWMLVVVLIVTILAGLVVKFRLTGADDDRVQYTLKRSILSPAERSFLGVLESLDFPDEQIYAKVRLADVFEVKKGSERAAWQRAFNRIASKHVDFLLVRRSDKMPLLGIELDDRSHEAERRKARDRFVTDLFQSAGLALLSVPARASYDPRELTRKIAAVLGEQAKTGG